MSKLTTLYKQPSESRLYSVDFSANLGTGETITSVISFVAVPAGLTLDPAVAISGGTVQKRISGGAAGKQYKITADILTSASNILEAECYLNVMEN